MKGLAPSLASLWLLTVVGACGASGESESAVNAGFPEAPYTTVTSEAGKLNIEVRTSPTQPLERGLSAVLYTITRDARAPVDGLDISVTPWMPAMAHGASVRPVVLAQGRGQYTVANLSLFMPGLWQLQTSISGAVDDRAIPTLEVR